MEEKTKASVNGKDLPISTKQAVALCSFIRKKNPKQAITLLEQVTKKKIAVPMKGEIPHRHGMSKPGRYPVKASQQFIKLLKSLIANATVKGLDAESLMIEKAMANKASRSIRATRLAFGRKKFKRTHILLEATEKEIKQKTEKKEKIEGVNKHEEKKENKHE